LDDAIEKASAEDEGFDITNLDEDLDLDLDLDDFDIDDSEVAVKTNVLDHEEVQELQDLLDDTDNFDIDDELSLDGLMEDDEMASSNDTVSNDDLLESLDDDILQALESESLIGSAENELEDAMEEFDFGDELLADEEESAKGIEESLDEEDVLGSLDDLLAFDEEFDDLVGLDDEKETVAEAESTVDEALDDLDALILDDLATMDDDEEFSSLEAVGGSLSDDEFDELEQQIQEAVEELDIEDLEQGLDDVEMGDIGDFEGLGDLDGLSERDIKLAIGEEVEEEPEVQVGNDSSLDAEALSEAIEKSPMVELDDELETIDIDTEIMGKSIEEHHGTPAEGMDALQALLKALSNEDVAKTLKGLSINININFGNEK